MSRLAGIILLMTLLAAASGADAPAPTTLPASGGVRFAPVHVFIDPHGKPLACYEVEIVVTAGDVKLVGVEGGDEGAFNDAPYYDKRALNGKRIILGAYSLGNNLPAARTRVATLHFRVAAAVEPRYAAILRIAGSSDETSIPATVSVEAHVVPMRGDRLTANLTGVMR